MPLPQIATYQLDEIITELGGETTLTELRTAQLEALPFDCPNCDDGTVEFIDLVSGVTSQIVCPLCQGMTKTGIEYESVCVGQSWQPVTP